MRAVNLLPRDAPVKSFAANRGVAFGGVGGAALVPAVLATMTLSAGGDVSQKQSELDALRAQIAAIPQPVSQTTGDDAQLAAEKGARVGALSIGAEAVASPGIACCARSRSCCPRTSGSRTFLPPRPRLATAAAAAAPPRPAGFTLVGSTYSQDGVARFLSRLSVVPDLANVRLMSSQSVLVEQREIVQFTVLADVRPPGAGS